MTSDEKAETILVFEPHPDDAAFQLGGAIAAWAARGCEVFVCTLTTGDNSTLDPAVTRAQIAAVLEKEHAAALDILGVPPERRVQWPFGDLDLDPGLARAELAPRMIGLIREVRPVTVVTMDPRNEPNEENPDHRAAAVAGLEAAALAAYPNHLPGQGPQHFVSRVLCYMSPAPDTFMDISGAPFDAKVDAGLAYDSQLELMLTEARERLAGLGAAPELLSLPPDQIWPAMCRGIAEEAAALCREALPEAQHVTLAEAFRTQYPGVVDKIRTFLPPGQCLL